jgi:hypothetical protein
MNRSWAAGALLGIVAIAGCGEPAVTDTTVDPSEVDGRWITVDVANATDEHSTLAVVDEDDTSRVIGVVDPPTVLGQTTQRVRLYVPDDTAWVVTSNGVGGLSAPMVDGWCGDLPVTINVADGIVDAAVPAFVQSGPGNCDGPIPPIRMSLYMRDEGLLTVGWKILSGPGVVAQGVVSEEPSAECILVPHDWELHFWTVEDFMERPDRLAGNAAATAADWLPAPDMELAIDVQVWPTVSLDSIPDWWDGPAPDCPELPDPPG